MAVDEALFHSAVQGLCPPTVRLYGWSRPTLSIGFRQELERTCDFEACRRLGIDVVRRLTGGRAVLHHRELTYCVAAGAEERFRGLSVREVYRWVSHVLRRALQKDGIPVDPELSQTHQDRPGPDEALPCFAVASRHEITSGGRKLVAGAQKWSPRGFVQHGSLLLEIDRTLWSKVWGQRTAHATEAVGVVELSGTRRTTSQLMQVLASEFARTLGETASEDQLLPGEMRRATVLSKEKYRTPEWNLFRRRTAAWAR